MNHSNREGHKAGSDKIFVSFRDATCFSDTAIDFVSSCLCVLFILPKFQLNMYIFSWLSSKSQGNFVNLQPKRNYIRNMANKEPGYVYILTNPSFREDWVKIGMTQNMEERLKTLDTTALPLPFNKYATLKTVKYQVAEKHVHHYIERFTNLRIRDNREFFNVKPEDALSIFIEVAELLDDAEIEVFDENAKKILEKEAAHKEAKTKKRGKNIKGEPEPNTVPAKVNDSKVPRFCIQDILPRYLSHLKSKLTLEAIAEMGINENIAEIRNIETLKQLRDRIKAKEKELKYHNTHSCAISKYISYLQNGYTFQDFEFDASLVEEKSGNPQVAATNVESKMTESVESPICFSQEMKDIEAKCFLDFYPQSNRSIVKAGSAIKEPTTDSCSQGVSAFREEIKKDNSRSRKEESGIYILLQDIEMPVKSSSPSGASQFCWGTSRPGPADWIDDEGRKYPTEWWKKK